MRSAIEIDDDTFKHGVHHYVVWYRMADVIRSFDDGDEFYPDVNGDHWAQPIGSITARLHVDPRLAPALDGRIACFPGTDEPCEVSTTTGELDWPQGYLDLPGSGVAEPDRAFALRAVKEAGVAAIPVSAFYEEAPVTGILRLCFSKADETLDEGIGRLARARELSRASAG